MDVRLLVVLAPFLLAAGWAVTRVLPVALQQLKDFRSKNANANV